MAKLTRRQFLANLGLSFGVGAAIECFVDTIPDFSKIDPTPVSCKKGKSHVPKENILDVTINGRQYKIVGISHSRDFIEENASCLERLVSDCSFAVLEAGPEEMMWCDNNSHSYFQSLINYCRKNKKPIVKMDGLSENARKLEKVETASGFASLFSVIVDSIQRKRTTLWEHRSRYARLALGIYLLYTTNLRYSNATPIRFDHVLDQRNVEVASRLCELDSLVAKEDFENGKYVLVNYGSAHLQGIDYYLRHPIIRRIKQALYSFNYGLLDSKEIARYTLVPEDSSSSSSSSPKSWKKEVLKK